MSVVHPTYALIKDERIKNVIKCDNYEVANQLARSEYGQDAIGVDCSQYLCGIGDFFVNNTFYSKTLDENGNEVQGEEIVRQNTAEEDAAEALKIVNELAETVAEVQINAALNE